MECEIGNFWFYLPQTLFFPHKFVTPRSKVRKGTNSGPRRCFCVLGCELNHYNSTTNKLKAEYGFIVWSCLLQDSQCKLFHSRPARPPPIPWRFDALKFYSRDGPIRGLCLAHVITLDQSETSWSFIQEIRRLGSGGLSRPQSQPSLQSILCDERTQGLKVGRAAEPGSPLKFYATLWLE